MADFSINVKVNGVEQSVSTIGELEDALKATNDELANLSIGSAEFNELSKQARVLDSNLKNIAVSLEGADTKKLAESFAKLGETIGGAFAIATSAVSLFGSESEDVAEAQVRAQQAIAIVLGARAIAEGVVEGAAAARLLVDKISVVTTNLLTSAVGANTVAQAANAVATGTATTAQLALNTAMKAAPYILIATALAGLAAVIFDVGEETVKAKKYQEDYNEVLDESANAVERRIQKERELVKIRGRIAETEAQTETEKLKARIDTQKQLDELDVEDLENRRKTATQKLAVEKRRLDIEAEFVKSQLELQKTLRDRNVEGQFNDQQKEIANLIKAREAKTVSEEQYYDGLIKIRKKYFSFTDEQDLTDFKNQNKRFSDLKNQIKTINDELDIAGEQRKAQEAEDQAEALRIQKEANQKRIDNYKAFAESAKNELASLREQEKQLSREIEDLILSRSAKEDDVVAQALLNIEKIKISRERDLEDNRKSLQSEIDDFIKASTEKKISKEKIDAEVAKLTERGREIQKSINDKYDILETQAVEDKNKVITEIDESLTREQSFGGFNLLDSKKKLLQEELEFNQDIAERKKLIDDDYWRFIVAKQPERITQAIAAQRAIIEAEREAKLQQLEIDLQNDLIQIQGTEEQKNEQKKNLENQYLEEKKRINEDTNTKIAETEIEIAKKTTQEKIELAQIGVGFATQGLQAFNNLSQALTNSQLKRVKDNADAEETIRQKAFKRQKALNIVGATINGAQAVLKAIAQFGPPPSPFGIAAIAAAGILTASQIALISSQKYSGADTGSTGGGSVPDVSIPGASVTQPAFGGFTGFNQNLVGTPTSGTGQTTPFTSGGGQMYVLESDITNTQNRVRVLESGASFG